MISRLIRSLRGRLIVLTVIVEIVMISAILWNSQRLAETHLLQQFELRRIASASTMELPGESTLAFLQTLPADKNRMDFHIAMQIDGRQYGEY